MREIFNSPIGQRSGYNVLPAPVFDVRLVLANFGVPVNLDAEVIARLLPVHFTLGNAEKVLDTHFVTTRNFEEGDACRCILLLTDPVGDRVVRWAPGKVTDALNLLKTDNLVIELCK